MIRAFILLLAAVTLMAGSGSGASAPRRIYADPTACRPSIVAIGFIGDSITKGLFTATPAASIAADDLDGYSIRASIVNEGHGGARTEDWSPGAPSGYLAEAEAAFSASGVRLVHVMLGTNDAAQGISTGEYRAHMATLLDHLIAHGYTPVVSAPIASTNVPTNRILQEQARVLATLINGTTVLAGDTRAYRYFETHPEYLIGAGLHPDDSGTPVLARYWADALRPLAPLGRCAVAPVAPRESLLSLDGPAIRR